MNKDEITELQRLIANLHRDYVHAAYHLERYLTISGIPVHDEQQILQDALLNVNSMRGDLNALYELLKPHSDLFKNQPRR